MSFSEALAWEAYMRKRGNLNLGSRVDQGFAMLAAYISKIMGGSGEIQNFLPKYPGAEDEGDATLDDLMSALIGARVDGKP